MSARSRAFGLLLMLALLLWCVSLVSAQSQTFGLSPDDRTLLGDSIVLSGEERFFAFDYSFDLQLSGMPDQGNISVSVTGEGRKAAGDFQITMIGSGTVNGETMPADLELRVVDSVIYARDAQEGTWRSLSEQELNAFMGGAVDSSGAAALGDMSQLAAGFSVNPDDFISISRMADTTVNGVTLAHFRWNLDLIDLANSPGFTNGLTALGTQPQLSGELSAAGIDSSQLAMAGMLIGMLFSDTTVTLDHYVNPAENRITQAVLNVDMNINPAMLGTAGSAPLILQMNLNVNLHDYGVPQTVTAPENAIVVTADEMLNPASLIAEEQIIAVQPTSVSQAVPTVSGGVLDITSLANITPAATPAGGVQLPSGGSLTAGVISTVELTGTGPVDLSYTGSANEIVTITARSSGSSTVDTTVELLNTSGVRLAYNDDHGTGRTDIGPFDSVIREVTLPASGVYTVRVNSFSGTSRGLVSVLLDSSGAAPLPTPTETASESADVITSVLEPRTTAEFPLTGSAGEVVTITVRALDNALDPRVAVIAPDGTTLAENDDHRSQDTSLARFDSRISDLVLPTSGTYTLRVSGFGGSGGQFELTVQRGGSGSLPAPTPTSVSGTQSGRETVLPGTLEQNGVFQYPLNVQPGDTYTFTARGTGGFDPVLLIRDASGALIAGNDDHNSSDSSMGRFDSRVLNYIFQQAASVSIEVEEYAGQPGSFTLTIERIDDSAPLGTGTEQVFTGQVNANGTFSQPFVAQAGDYVTITVRGLTSDFDPVVALISPSGVLVTDNDNHSSEQNIGDFDSYLRNVLITETGSYTIEITGVRGSSGSFALTVRTLR